MLTGKRYFNSYTLQSGGSPSGSARRSLGSRWPLLAAVALLAAGCSTTSGGETANGGADLVQPGNLTVCTDAPYKPFEYPDDSSPIGYTGFDLDIVDAIAQAMRLQVVVVDQNYDGLQSGAALAAGQCDIVASAMTITEEREANLDFSDPYYDSKQSLLAPTGATFRTIADLGGKKIGVQQGTTGAEFAAKKLPPTAELVAFPSDGELYAALESGNLDAVLQDLPVNLEHTKGTPFTIVEEYDTGEEYGFAVRERGSEALLQTVNAALQKLRDSGTYQQIYEKYFAKR
jgi:polar amino acid transport system substrate-binding protein